MKSISNKAIILTAHELLILLFRREIDGLVLPEEITDLSADEMELKNAFGELISDKYIVPGEDGSYKMSPEIVQIMDLLSTAVQSFVVYDEKNKITPCYIYRLNLMAVCLRVDEHNRNLVKLEYTYMEDKIQELMDINLPKLVIYRFRRGHTEAEKSIYAEEDMKNTIMDKLLEE